MVGDDKNLASIAASNFFNCFYILDMDLATRRRRLIIRGAALVVVVSAWLFVRFRRMSRSLRALPFGPMFERDQQRMNNLNFIYESNDMQCVELLRMKRAPFFQLCDLFRTRG